MKVWRHRRIQLLGLGQARIEAAEQLSAVRVALTGDAQLGRFVGDATVVLQDAHRQTAVVHHLDGGRCLRIEQCNCVI